ncbi:MAG: EAL domain-containing protein [Roseiflexus sp.]|uniref:two-component system response regulator n=1 Tax=Roseiflexus sp. TaxID=2562120 RepID=UPI0025F187A8|nr:EAL domain-containing protein [Roseiflexus sp.]MCL6540115.1 EAL domain-containing protein [Roseiflexus sp.]
MPPHILVITDDDDNRALLIRLLQSQGQQVAVAVDGQEALELLSRQVFDLILLDLDAADPDMREVETLRQLCQYATVHSIPVAVIADAGDLDLIARCIELGADYYLLKPFNETLLRARVHALLERKAWRDRQRALPEESPRAPADAATGVAPFASDLLLALLDALGRAWRDQRRIATELQTLEARIAEYSATVEDTALALRHQTITLHAILESLSDAVVMIDREGNLVHANPAAHTLFGDRLLDVTPQATAPALLDTDGVPCTTDQLPLAVALRGVEVDSSEFLLASVDPDAVRRIRATARPLRDSNGDTIGAVAIFHDITALVQMAEALRAGEERYALTVQATGDGVWEWELRTGTMTFSQRWKEMLGFQDQEIGNRPSEWFDRVHPDDRDGLDVRLTAYLRRLITSFEHEYRILHRDGAYRWMRCRGIAVWDVNGNATHIVGSQTDITDRKLAEQRLWHNAFHDSLTGLANRARFMDRLGHVIARTRRSASPIYAVLILDLDRFKLINDSLGHLIGDQLLIAIARRLEQSVRPGDTLARLGGDEFAVLLEDLSEPHAAVNVAERIMHLFEEPFHVNGHEVFSSASIGIVLSDDLRYHSPSDMLRDADTAMYHAKMEGRARYAVFHPTMHDRARLRLQIETDLRRGIERNEFFVVYQPIVELSTQRTVGFEALLRWRHPQRGIVTPAEFIAIAEETGLIVPIGQMVLHEACRQLSAWKQRHPERTLSMNINLSPRQIADPDLVHRTAALIDEYRLDTDALRLEITETAIIEHGDAAGRVLQQLRALGVQICIDDFGTGYSSLSYLHRFPIATIKIDRSFVSQIHRSHENTEIVRSIISLARSLGMAVIAEGTETEDQLIRLRSMSCAYGQGWLFAHALEPAEATAMLDRETE